MKLSSLKILYFVAGSVVGCIVVLGVLLLFTPIISSVKLLNEYPINIEAGISHSHSKVDVQEGQVAPTLQVLVFQDKMKPGNYSINIKTTGFIFSPDNVSSKAKFGEGHAHIYIDDVLFVRAYSNWIHIPKLKDGKHKIYITLNHNDHKEYSINGITIGSENEVNIQENHPNKMKM
jgi:hypothetical protein